MLQMASEEQRHKEIAAYQTLGLFQTQFLASIIEGKCKPNLALSVTSLEGPLGVLAPDVGTAADSGIQGQDGSRGR